MEKVEGAGSPLKETIILVETGIYPSQRKGRKAANLRYHYRNVEATASGKALLKRKGDWKYRLEWEEREARREECPVTRRGAHSPHL